MGEKLLKQILNSPKNDDAPAEKECRIQLKCSFSGANFYDANGNVFSLILDWLCVFYKFIYIISSSALFDSVLLSNANNECDV